MPRCGGLDLQLLPHEVLDAQVGARERVAPHLEHPAKDGVGLSVGLEFNAEIEPERRHLLQSLDVHQRRRGSHRLHGQMVAAKVALHHLRLLARNGRHVRKEKGHVELGRGPVGDVLEDEVVCLGDEDVVFHHARAPCVALEHLAHRPRAVDHLKPSRRLTRSLLDDDGWHGIDKSVWLGTARREQPREARHLGAHTVLLHLFEVVVHNLRLPLLVDGRLSGEDHVERSAARRAWLVGSDPSAPCEVVGRVRLGVGHRQPILRTIEKPLAAEGRLRVFTCISVGYGCLTQGRRV
mmetsp:Transcript_32894/g.72258  ORF Transcript_32894/g.72258 Transcript_32894/m.72258 type:complete len:294 (+) Transcript_32894:774-1655(+)